MSKVEGVEEEGLKTRSVVTYGHTQGGTSP